MAVKQLSVYAENKKGVLVKTTAALAAVGVDMKSIMIADTEEFGIIRMMVSDVEAAKTALKNVGFNVSAREVAAVAIPNETGELNRVLQLIADEGINLDYMYSIINDQTDKAYMALRVDDNAAVEALLADKGYQILTDADI